MQRGITDPATLLRTFLLHVARGYSLLETTVRAQEAGLAAISDVGLLKRLRRSELWLRRLCMELRAENGVRMPAERWARERADRGRNDRERARQNRQPVEDSL